MKVIVIASRKGGSGKTTLAGHLAVQAERAGAGPVALIDSDPQGSLSEWWNRRAAATPVFVQTSLGRMAQDVEQLRTTGIRLLVIDTPPALSAAIGEVVRLSDLVLIPSRPSPHDLRSIGATARLVEQHGRPLIFVLNAATPRARITTEAVGVLSHYGVLAPVIVHQRVGFASSMIDGRSVMELAGESRSAKEIEMLWRYLDARLSGVQRPGEAPDLPSHPVAGQGLAVAGAARRG